MAGHHSYLPHMEIRHVCKHILSVTNSFKEDSKLGMVVCTVTSAPRRQSSGSCKFTLGYTAPGQLGIDEALLKGMGTQARLKAHASMPLPSGYFHHVRWPLMSGFPLCLGEGISL